MRTAEKISTKDKLLDAAQGLMIEKGYGATTVDEICSIAEVTKGSFFHYFKNKEELGKFVIERFANMQHDMMQQAINTKTADPLERVYGYIDFGIEASKNPEMKGCLVGNLAQEISETHPELRDICSKCFTGFADMIREELISAREKYKPKTDFDVDSLASYFLAIFQGSILVMKATQDRTIMQKNLEHCKNYIKTLFCC